ncbi:MAG: hypothetical protein MJ252_05815 [archaeon]|nr:hypothetical protein [archaeon]
MSENGEESKEQNGKDSYEEDFNSTIKSVCKKIIEDEEESNPNNDSDNEDNKSEEEEEFKTNIPKLTISPYKAKSSQSLSAPENNINSLNFQTNKNYLSSRYPMNVLNQNLPQRPSTCPNIQTQNQIFQRITQNIHQMINKPNLRNFPDLSRSYPSTPYNRNTIDNFNFYYTNRSPNISQINQLSPMANMNRINQSIIYYSPQMNLFPNQNFNSNINNRPPPLTDRSTNRILYNPYIPNINQREIKTEQHYASMNIFSKFEAMARTEKKFSEIIVHEFKDSFYSILKIQELSKLSQGMLLNSDENEIHLVFEVLKKNIANLLKEPYANYFCMKLYSFLNKEDKVYYLNALRTNIKALSTNKISTYPIQFLIENTRDLEEQILFVSFVKPTFLEMALDLYGCHIIEKIINVFEYEACKELSKDILENFMLFSNNSNGLCIIKKFIEKEYRRDYFRELKEIMEINALVLVQNPLGNYAIQIAFDNWELGDCISIMNKFKGETIKLSVQKFSSNVIEKCFEKEEKFLLMFMDEIFSKNYAGTKLLLENNYGNYVLNKALSCAKKEIRDKLINAIQIVLAQINDKKVIKKWNNVLSNYLY